MTLMLMESFDDGLTSYKWTTAHPGSVSGSGIIADGRHGQGCRFRFPANWSNYVPPADAHATAICGIAVRAFSLGPPIVTFWSGGVEQGRIGSNGTTGFLYYYAPGTTVTTNASKQLLLNSWQYLEWKLICADSGGRSILRLNGEVILDVTGDTRNAGNGLIDGFRIGHNINVDPDLVADDIYICNGAGTVNNDFLGEVRVEARFPDGNGNYSEFVGSDDDSVDNYALVDESPNPATADYVQSSVADSIDTYQMQELESAGTPAAVFLRSFAQKTDTGTRRLRGVMRSGGVDHIDSDDEFLGLTYAHQVWKFEANPLTGSQWSKSEVDAAEFGIQVK